eukprot:COSAG01_NODE_5078_length_4502_cov_6.740177_2_plen_337_part_00
MRSVPTDLQVKPEELGVIVAVAQVDGCFDSVQFSVKAFADIVTRLFGFPDSDASLSVETFFVLAQQCSMVTADVFRSLREEIMPRAEARPDFDSFCRSFVSQMMLLDPPMDRQVVSEYLLHDTATTAQFCQAMAESVDISVAIGTLERNLTNTQGDLPVGMQLAQAMVSQVQQAAMTAGLTQGLRFTRSRRVDLSNRSFGDLDADHERVLAIARTCGPDLDALFLRVPLLLPPPVVAQLREACPNARCLALGGEVAEAGFDDILRQYAEVDSELTQAIQAGAAMRMIAEGVPPSAAHEVEPEPEAQRPELAPEALCRTLDLTDSQFRHLTDAGLGA